MATTTDTSSVPAQRASRFTAAKLREAVSAQTVGNGLDSGVTLGPLIDDAAVAKVEEHIEDAIAHGAKILVGGRRHTLGGTFFQPTILTDVPLGTKLMREETFGPIVGIMKVTDDAEALTLMNDSPYGLTASLWTADLDAAETLGARIQAGTIFANRCDYLDPGLVWTGVKESGRGGALSEIGYQSLTQPKSYHLREV